MSFLIRCVLGELLVIDDTDGGSITEELECRRVANFLNERDFMPESKTPEQQRSRFKWQHCETCCRMSVFEGAVRYWVGGVAAAGWAVGLPLN